MRSTNFNYIKLFFFFWKHFQPAYIFFPLKIFWSLICFLISDYSAWQFFKELDLPTDRMKFRTPYVLMRGGMIISPTSKNSFLPQNPTFHLLGDNGSSKALIITWDNLTMSKAFLHVTWMDLPYICRFKIYSEVFYSS